MTRTPPEPPSPRRDPGRDMLGFAIAALLLALALATCEYGPVMGWG
jgi:hypothetical protein